MGDRNNFNRKWSASLRAYENEIVVVVPLKAEGAAVPGAGVLRKNSIKYQIGIVAAICD